MVIDSHCHLDDEQFENTNILEVIDNCNYLQACVSLGTDEVTSQKNVLIANKNKKVYACVGFHPECAQSYRGEKTIEFLKYLAKDKRVLAIGEIGLDYHYTIENCQLQKEIFEAQIKLAYKLKLPICIHCRDAVSDLYKILSDNKKYLKYGFLLHCFSESLQWVQKFVDLGAYFSFAGNFTYKSYNKEVLKYIPLNKILVETDSPYLAPVPLRGSVNNPCNCQITLNAIALFLNLDSKELSKQVLKNTKKFYKIK